MDQYKKLASFLHNTYKNTNLANDMKLYTEPCTEITIWITFDKRNVRTVSHRIALSYDSDEFKEIVNNQAFTANDLWS